jgi:S-formylglutathione hydrolase FrmB
MHVLFDVIRGGGHDFHTWAVALKDAFPWLVTRLHSHSRTPVV